MIHKGDRLRIKEAWQDPGDDDFEWRAVEDEDGGRVLISPVDIGLPIPPQQVVRTNMVERVLYGIGDVVVHRGEPPDGNPYRGQSLAGSERVAALLAFRDGCPCSEYTFWYAPCCGGARRCRRDDVEWGTLLRGRDKR